MFSPVAFARDLGYNESGSLQKWKDSVCSRTSRKQSVWLPKIERLCKRRSCASVPVASPSSTCVTRFSTGIAGSVGSNFALGLA